LMIDVSFSPKLATFVLICQGF